MIENAKQKQLEAEKQKAKMREKMSKDTPTSQTVARAYGDLMSGTSTTTSETQGPRRRKKVQQRAFDYMDALGMEEELFFNQMDKEASAFEMDKADEGTRDQPHSRLFDQLDDFTMIPAMLDAKFQQYDSDRALKSTIITAGRDWTRSRQENLLVVSQKTELGAKTISSEKNKALDLLIAISRSGSLSIESSDLHIIVAVSHCFEKQIMETIIEDDINPIEKMERSMRMIAGVIHNVAEGDLICGEKKKEEIDYDAGE